MANHHNLQRIVRETAPNLGEVQKQNTRKSIYQTVLRSVPKQALQQELYVITGGPGVGKTTLISALAVAGQYVVPEAARSIIEEQQIREQQGHDGILPWKSSAHYAGFQTLVLERQLANEAHIEGRAFLDRGVHDNIAYCVIGGVTVDGLAEQARMRDYKTIFILEPLPSYVTDAQRIEDSTLAKQLHNEINKTYRNHGYEPISVPAIGIEERVQFILDYVGKRKNQTSAVPNKSATIARTEVHYGL